MLRSLAETNWPLFAEWMGFPEDLPDLTLFPPERNTKPEGVGQSCYEKKRRGELPEVY